MGDELGECKVRTREVSCMRCSKADRNTETKVIESPSDGTGKGTVSAGVGGPGRTGSRRIGCTIITRSARSPLPASHV